MQPSIIAPGESSIIYFDVQDIDYWKQTAQGLVKHCKAKSLDNLRLEIYPTVGSTVRVVPDQNVLDLLGPFFEEENQAIRKAQEKAGLKEPLWVRMWDKLIGSKIKNHENR